MEIAEAIATLSANPDYWVLHRLVVADEHVFADNVTGESCARLAVIDTETTGFKPDLGARIIDLAIATCEYGLESGTLYRVVDRYEKNAYAEQKLLQETFLCAQEAVRLLCAPLREIRPARYGWQIVLKHTCRRPGFGCRVGWRSR